MFSLRDPYILFLEETFKFKSQSYKSQKISGLFINLRPMSVRFYGPCKGVVRRPFGLPTTIARVYDHFWGQNDNLKPCAVLRITLRCPYGDRTMSLRCVYRLQAYDFFQICHCAELNKIVAVVGGKLSRQVYLAPHLPVYQSKIILLSLLILNY